LHAIDLGFIAERMRGVAQTIVGRAATHCDVAASVVGLEPIKFDFVTHIGSLAAPESL